jgi:hypothetical protein
MIELTDTQKFKIRELQNDAVYMSILHELHERYATMPTFNPNQGGTPDEKFSRYVHRSGFIQGVQILCEHLGYRNDRES